MEMSQDEACKLKRMYILQEEKIELLEQIIKEQEQTINFLKRKFNAQASVTRQTVESVNMFKDLINEKYN